MYHASIGPATEFRVANQDDIITAARMIFESYAPYIPIMGKIPPTIFEDFGHHIAQQNLWILQQYGDTVGMVVLTPHDDHLLLQSMCVLPAYQGMGFGREILRFAESRARYCRKPVIRLYTNSLMERNQRIYKRSGYREQYRMSYDWGYRVHMEKKISMRSRSRLEKTLFQDLANALG
jgi:ribosomal protein S18 acetylase RimI-like enzyme